MIQLTLTLKVTTAQVVETSVTVNNNSPIQDYVHPDDQTQPFEMTPGFKPFTVFIFCTFVRVETTIWPSRAIFAWPWHENRRTKQKQQTNGNRAIWLVYRTDTNARGFWLVIIVKRTRGCKNFMPENFLEINRYFALTSCCNTNGQSSNTFSILGFSLAGKRRFHVLIFSSIGW